MKKESPKRFKVFDTDKIWDDLRAAQELEGLGIDWQALKINPARITEKEKGKWTK